jgi:hypothetical protein
MLFTRDGREGGSNDLVGHYKRDLLKVGAFITGEQLNLHFPILTICLLQSGDSQNAATSSNVLERSCLSLDMFSFYVSLSEVVKLLLLKSTDSLLGPMN